MKDDTREELERLEKELLTEEQTPAVSDETVFFTPVPAKTPEADTPDTTNVPDETIVIPAFDDPDTIHEPEEPLVYRNFSNDYGKDLKPAKTGFWAAISRDDKITMGLMIAISALCLGIIGVLIYWLAAWKL